MRRALLVLLAACRGYWPCPDRAPVNGEPCDLRADHLGDYCEYGGNDHGDCRTTASCGYVASLGHAVWIVDKPTADCGVNRASCPAAFGVNEGSACYSQTPGCTYDEGVCDCEQCTPADGTNGTYWHCRRWDDVATGCPVPPPFVGDGCDHEGLSCDYFRCCNGPQIGGNVVCKDGIWEPAPVNTGCACVDPQCP